MTIDGIEREPRERENQPAGMSFDERFLASVVVCRRVPPRVPGVGGIVHRGKVHLGYR